MHSRYDELFQNAYFVGFFFIFSDFCVLAEKMRDKIRNFILVGKSGVCVSLSFKIELYKYYIFLNSNMFYRLCFIMNILSERQ